MRKQQPNIIQLEITILSGINELARLTKEKIIGYAKTGFERPLVEDLGDYLPFLAYFGQKEICEEHISACSTEIFSPSLPTEREDTLLGLIEYHRWTGDKASLKLARSYVDYLFSNYCYRGRIITPVDQYIEHVFERDRARSTKNHMTKIGLKFIHSLLGTRVSIPRNGIFIELLTDMYDLTQEPKYLNMAESFAAAWLRDEAFGRFGLFPSFRLNPFKGEYAVLAKDNTALLFGFLALYEKTQKEMYRNGILKWCKSVRERCFDKSVYGRYYFSNGKRDGKELVYAFMVMDALCDAFFVLKERTLLSFAEDIAKFWINLQSKIGLFPEAEASNVSYQDYTNDFCISLWRLYELTGKDYYREVSERAMEGLFKFHVFSLKVDYRSGEIIDAGILPKNVFLMSKPIILLEKGAIYKEKKVFKLLRDR